MGFFSKSLLGRMMNRHSGLVDKLGGPKLPMPPGFGDDHGRGGGEMTVGPGFDPEMGARFLGGIDDQMIPVPKDPTVADAGAGDPAGPAAPLTGREAGRQWAQRREAELPARIAARAAERAQGRGGEAGIDPAPYDSPSGPPMMHKPMPSDGMDFPQGPPERRMIDPRLLQRRQGVDDRMRKMIAAMSGGGDRGQMNMGPY